MHTEGPWATQLMPDGVWLIIDPDSDNADILAVVDPDNTREDLGESAKDNARLMAAAPKMKELLKRAADCLQDYAADEEHMNDALAMEIYRELEAIDGNL